MCLKRIRYHAKRYKFLKNNIWGRLFVMKPFRGKKIVYSIINRRHTLKKVRLNAPKLRRKKLTIKGLGIMAALRIKSFYLNLNSFQLKNIVRQARKLKFYKISSKKPVRVYDNLAGLLEFRLENILQRTGLASPQYIKLLLSHRQILVDGHIVTFPSYRLQPGMVVTFRSNKLLKKLIFEFCRKNNIKRKFCFKYKTTSHRLRPLVQPFMALNKLSYFTMSLNSFKIIVGNKPAYAKGVYYPFNADLKNILLHYNNI